MNLKDRLLTAAFHTVGKLAQEQDHHNPVKTITPGMPQLLRRAAAEGAVLLENRVLPLAPGTRVSLFGRVQMDTFATGYGSGGDVNAPYTISFQQGLRDCEGLSLNENLAAVYTQWVREHPADHGFWGHWPLSHPEMPVTEALVRKAREDSDQAVIVLGRSSGEDRESLLEPGSFYLTAEEENLLKTVTEVFPDAVLLLNIGSIPDLGFLRNYSLGAVLILWQGGMESGYAAADLLSGAVSPCGHLTDTVARTYADYPSAGHFGQKDRNEYFEDIYVGYRFFETFHPERVLYPFGHGLSYTRFARETEQIGPLSFQVTVTNVGDHPGRDTVMLFAEKPQGPLGNPARELAAFAKTRTLRPGESETLDLTVTRYQLCSYDSTGAAGARSCYVLLGGIYRFHCGGDIRSTEAVGAYLVPQTTVFKRCQEAAAPTESFRHLARREGKAVHRQAAIRQSDLKARILDSLPKSLPLTGDQGLTLKDVQEGRTDLDTFTAQLSVEELEAISRGGYVMGNSLGPRGNAGVFGGVTESLRRKGIPAITTTDGPSGIRLYDSCSLLPIGTLLACTFDTALVEELYAAVAREMDQRGSDVLLAPGMNIHRDPLCGRNFEYFSEDPYLTGRMAAAVVKGVQSQGKAACPKHFACNSQETNRNRNDSVLSERALREIYLKGFEICVKLAKPRTLMTSYNKINGVWGHYHYDLVETILRREWGYEGLVITDWWMQYAPSPEFPALTGNAYRVRSGVDVLMPGARFQGDPRRRPDGTLLATLGKPDGITLGELQRCAQRVLRFILELKEMRK